MTFPAHAGANDNEAFVALNAIGDVAAGVPWQTQDRAATVTAFKEYRTSILDD